MCNCTQVILTAATGVVNISVANPNLDGTGTIVALVTGANDGNKIKSITIKATGSTTQGMIRFFVNVPGTSTNFLLKEIRVPATTQTGVVPAFIARVPWGLNLTSGSVLYASTENSESFNVSVDAITWRNCECPKV